MPGVERLLDALDRPFCVASNGNRAKLEFTLGHTGLLPRFAGRVFSADDVPEPKPRSPSDVRVRTLEVGICGTDKDILDGQHGAAPKGEDFLILGHECLGEVVEVGSAVQEAGGRGRLPEHAAGGRLSPARRRLLCQLRLLRLPGFGSDLREHGHGEHPIPAQRRQPRA